MAQTTMPAPPRPAFDTLVGELNALCDAQPYHVGWSLKDVRAGGTGLSADRNGDVLVAAGSTRKVAILAAALSLVHAGEFRLNQPVEVRPDRYLNQGLSVSGIFQHFSAPFTITLHDVLTMMIIVSDNTSTGIVAEMVGLERVNAYCRALGMAQTMHREVVVNDGTRYGGKDKQPLETMNATTPNEQGLLFELLLRGSTDPAGARRLRSTPELCQVALRILGWQMLVSRMPAQLPLGARVAHKTGTNEGRNYNDGGIVYKGRDPRFILTAYTEHVPVALPDGAEGRRAVPRLIATLTRTCWDALA